jgi:hypothetical protein
VLLSFSVFHVLALCSRVFVFVFSGIQNAVFVFSGIEVPVVSINTDTFGGKGALESIIEKMLE